MCIHTYTQDTQTYMHTHYMHTAHTTAHTHTPHMHASAHELGEGKSQSHASQITTGRCSSRTNGHVETRTSLGEILYKMAYPELLWNFWPSAGGPKSQAAQFRLTPAGHRGSSLLGNGHVLQMRALHADGGGPPRTAWRRSCGLVSLGVTLGVTPRAHNSAGKPACSPCRGQPRSREATAPRTPRGRPGAVTAGCGTTTQEASQRNNPHGH